MPKKENYIVDGNMGLLGRLLNNWPFKLNLMKTFVVIVIVLAIIYLLIREFWHKINWSRKTIEPEIIEGERTIDEIFEGRHIDEYTQNWILKSWRI